MSNPKFNRVVKDKLFYCTYQYSVSFTLGELSCIRHLDHQLIDDIIQSRIKWRKNVRHASNVITDETVVKLHNLLDEILSISTDYKVVVSYNRGYLYTNDISIVDKFSVLSYLNNIKLTQAVVNRPLNTIKLKKSAHRHRSYFKCVKLEHKERDSIRDFLTAQQSDVRIGPALAHYFKGSHRLTLDHYFIDYSDPGIIVMLSLIKPNLIRKTLDIILA
jgi:hypothetical protein